VIYLVDFSKFGKENKEKKNEIRFKEEKQEVSEEKNNEEKTIHRFKSFNEFESKAKLDEKKITGAKIDPVTKNKPKIIRKFETPRKPPTPKAEKPKNVMRKVNVQCPFCKKQKEIEIPEDIINQSKQLTTISINNNSVCSHSFQIFVDKNFKVRGSQKPAYEVNGKTKERKGKQKVDRMMNLAKGMDNLREYDKAKEKGKIEQTERPEQESTLKERIGIKGMTPKDIYDTFWDFIDDNNHEFREFIIKDPRSS